ncbi:COMM domain-containing protein 8-like [Schistocerca americana]|uniref:COMM domain-containing protein 8-like n=1 Tax=Schistocerca americana TaxID=7009 RepID=UPI001F4FFF6D|nr:COMM domain-containing protein 8-like [Schistocerca americana]XP_047119613.1 COMM domain-containing protein 8-like [Schistocerca piceifrons]XP_049940493.1 COMM domain-containing protein 8-like [Schistocerca serialis cubense]
MLSVNCQEKLQKLDCQLLNKVLHSCADELCGRNAMKYEAVKASTDWTAEEHSCICNEIKKLFSEVVGNSLGNEMVLANAPELDVSHRKCLLDCLDIHRKDIKRTLIADLASISGPVLKDFDWKLKWVMGSSKMSSLREPLLQMDFHLSQGKSQDEMSSSTVNVEMDRNELKNLLSSLERAQEAVKNLHN